MKEICENCVNWKRLTDDETRGECKIVLRDTPKNGNCGNNWKGKQ